MHDLKVLSGGVFDQMKLVLLHWNFLIFFDTFNDSIDAFAYEYEADANPPPHWTKLSRYKWSFSLIYKYNYGHLKNVYLPKMFF